ncbi:MAG: prolyl oligopeptidase family serine peptidase [Planctomycetota bacterium]
MNTVLPLFSVLLACPALASDLAPDAPFETFEEASAWVKTTDGGLVRNRVQPRWIGDGPDFWYRIDTGPGAAEFVLVRPESGVRESAFDPAPVAAAISRRGGDPVTAGRLPFRVLEFPDGAGGPVRFSARGRRWEATGASVRELENAQNGALDGPQSENVIWFRRPRPSDNVGGRTTVTFVNRSDGPVRLFWLSGSGERPYGTVAAGAEREMSTYAGHTWILRDANGRALGALAGTESAGRAIITGPDPNFRENQWERRAKPAPRSPYEFRGGDIFRRETGKRLTKIDDERLPDSYENAAYRGPQLVSPDGRTVAVMRTAIAPVRKIRIAPPEVDGVTVKPFTMNYPKPGDLRDLIAPVFFDTRTDQRVDVDVARLRDPYSVGRWRWSADSEELYFLHNPRGHQSLQVFAADRKTGALRAVVDERSDTFVDYSQKTELRWLETEPGEPEQFLWASERSGWNHLYRINAETGEVMNAVTSGDWVMREIERIEDGRVWFTALGIVPGQDPYHRHLCRVDLDGSNLSVLTSDAAEPGDGTHEWEFSDDGSLLFDRFSRVDLPPVTVLRDGETGETICELERADASAKLATGWRPPRRFVAKGRDGETDIFGFVIFPPGIDPETAAPGSIPIIENIYAGPHSAFVAKGWKGSHHTLEHAALGFAVVRCDGMGTNWRSKAFHDVAWRDIADSGFPDRVRFIQALAEKYPALDTSRVGIYGGSAGGQSAMRALLSHNDLYSVAVADCGCHDNRVDKMWWNEAWMGKLGPHYSESSNIDDAVLLKGDLLLTVGGSDRNVDPVSTYQTADALEAAGKDFTLKIYPAGGHGVGERTEARRLRAEFFIEHLMNRRAD